MLPYNKWILDPPLRPLNVRISAHLKLEYSNWFLSCISRMSKRMAFSLSLHLSLFFQSPSFITKAKCSTWGITAAPLWWHIMLSHISIFKSLITWLMPDMLIWSHKELTDTTQCHRQLCLKIYARCINIKYKNVRSNMREENFYGLY